MSAEPGSAIRIFGPLVQGVNNYTPILAPYDCDYFEIIQTSDGSSIQRSSDGTDAHSYQIPASAWVSVGAPSRVEAGGTPVNSTFGKAKRFLAGNPVTYLKGLTSTPTVAVEFLQ